MKFVTLYIMLCLFAQANTYASDPDTIVHGGRLYDKWWTDTRLSPPDSTHSAYVSGKKSGSTTWRCKECHGWDYRGKDGAYEKGSHYTGIKGIHEASGKPVKDILAILTNKRHKFGDVLGNKDLEAIASFVSEGQIDMTKLISYESKDSNGDSKRGSSSYQKHCADCHGIKGDALNLAHDKNKTIYIGTISNKNPWETLHKIRFGHPGAVMGMQQMHNGMRGGHHHRGMGKMWQAMPPMYGIITTEEQVDILTYLQTLRR